MSEERIVKESSSAQLPQHLGVVEWFRPGEYDRVERALEDLAQLGIRRLRTGVSWADLYTPEGDAWYQWLIPRLGRELELLPCFLYTPPSIGLEQKTSAPPVHPKDYADFIDVFISRYGEYFEYVELWNEPNNLSEWDWTLDPHWTIFGEMIGGAAYWAKQRGKKTVLGGMSPIDAHWLCRMFDLGVMEHIDVVGIHGFPDIFDYTWKGWHWNIDSVREVLTSHGSPCEIWVTEAGFSTWQHDERKQIEVFLDFLKAPADRVYWYGIDDLDPMLAAVNRFHLDDREYFFGLRRADGTPKLLFRLLEQGGVPLLNSVLATKSAPRPAPSFRDKATLITGGAGFIGTNLAHRLLSEGERVIIYDNLSRPGVERNLLGLKEKYGALVEARLADIRNAFQLGQAVREAKQVFHFAAQVAVTTSVKHPGVDFDINANGAISLLEAIRKAPEPPPLIFTSTNKVYGGMQNIALERVGHRYQPVDPRLRDYGLCEATPLDFHSPYGCSKGCVDQYVIDYARSFGLPAAVFRMSCIYGPHQFGSEDQGWVAHFALRTLSGQPITIYGDGCQIRDVLFVEDLVDALLRARDLLPGISGQAFNIGGGPQHTLTLLELLELLQALKGDLPAIDYGDWRLGDQKYYVSDIRKFSEVSGWRPRHTVIEGVSRLYDWLSQLAPPRKPSRRCWQQNYPQSTL
ncbi:NAD-dependent dehydratase [Geomonas silvestris]|uniref:NAD-dependent dehydratase n=1 Tax=Geomonas silvestris TaxID=2740184 RepID=A0A6V8MCM4_9BACT|nr:NAD-dependent epimerase/dehydratase family protein [Geomonas silvestris]GFO57741.1 NAD-dependent dehydratase [Geomonas silvestris]